MLLSQCFTPATGRAAEDMRALQDKCGLRLDRMPQQTVLLYAGDRAVATGSRDGDVLRYIAVDPAFEGEGACAALVGELIAAAAEAGVTDLLLFTKPVHKRLFGSLGFYALIESEDALLMENRRDGIARYLAGLERREGVSGAVVMNANPFTNGHLYLCEQAAAQCDFLYAFILSEDASRFSAAARLAMAKAATAHIPNLRVYPGGRYMISAATFPLYFIKEEARAEDVRADLDILLFARRIAPPLGICKRFVGTEPFCPVTARYNARLEALLPPNGIQLCVLERKDDISASAVRRLLSQGDLKAVRALVPPSVYEYLLRDP